MYMLPELFRSQCNMLCTSGFMDDVMFSHNGANEQNRWWRVCFVQFARWRHRGEVCRLQLCHHVMFFF